MSMHNNEDLLKKKPEELYVKFKGIINKIHERYNFLEIDDNKFKSLVLIIIEKCLKTYEKNQFISFHTYCFGKLDEFFDQYAIEIMDMEKEEQVEQDDEENLTENEEDFCYSKDEKYLPNTFQSFCENLKPLITVKEEQELALKIKNKDKDARNELIERNLRLVISIAKKYANKGLSFMDLIQEGNIGLMKAVDRFDMDMGYRFSTYATWWIKQAITRALADKGKIIRIPVHMEGKITKYLSTISILERRLGREPLELEIAEELGMSLEAVRKLSSYKSDVVSINTAVGNEEDTELGDFIPDTIDINDKLEKSFINYEILKLLKKCELTPKEIKVLMLRFGFFNDKVSTLEEVGRIYNVTRERIRQIEKKALNKIRNSGYIKDFAIYMDDPDASIEYIKTFKKNYYNKK